MTATWDDLVATWDDLVHTWDEGAADVVPDPFPKTATLEHTTIGVLGENMLFIETFDYVVGDDEALGLWVTNNDALVDLSAGYTFEVVVGDGTSGAGGFTKTSGITGAAGAGVPPSGTPNVVIAWAGSGELNDLAGDVTYEAMLTCSGTVDRKRPFFLRMAADL